MQMKVGVEVIRLSVKYIPLNANTQVNTHLLRLAAEIEPLSSGCVQDFLAVANLQELMVERGNLRPGLQTYRLTGFTDSLLPGSENQKKKNLKNSGTAFAAI